MSFKKSLVVGIVMMAVVFSSTNVLASNPMDKLGRGIANIAFGPLELLIKPYDTNNDKGAIAALTAGVVRGVCYTIARECVGVVDVVTFLVPLPGCSDDPMSSEYGYGPIMTPEWVIDPAHNAFNFFYNDQAIIEVR